MADNGNGVRNASLRSQLGKVDLSREQIAKAWLVDVILNSDLSDVEAMPLAWAAGELPQLISEILGAIGGDEAALDHAVQRASRLADRRGSSTTPAQLTREIAYLHSALLATLRMELGGSDLELFAEASERLAAIFTRISGRTVEALTQQMAADPASGLLNTAGVQRRLEQLIALNKRYGSPFALLVIDFDGPGAQNGDEAMGVVSHAVRGSIRLMDEAYRSEHDGVYVLAPNQTADSAALMARRLTEILTRLERAGGLRINISAGIVACPEHGDEPSELLHAADTAMWRARATGQTVNVAGLQER
jgi:diguanylate cyclase (GGDEF)-like protein